MKMYLLCIVFPEYLETCLVFSLFNGIAVVGLNRKEVTGQDLGEIRQ